MSADFPVTIRPAAVADASTLASLGAITFSETFGHLYAREDLAAFLSGARSHSTYLKLLQDPHVRVTLAVNEEAGAVGYCVAGKCKLPVADLQARAGEVRELYVLTKFQQHRIGTQLLADGLAWLDAQNFSPLYVGVWSENHGAQRLYRRLGFEKVGEYGFPVGDHIDQEFILRRTPAP